MRHEANNPKDNKAGEEAGQTVANGHHQRVPVGKKESHAMKSFFLVHGKVFIFP